MKLSPSLAVSIISLRHRPVKKTNKPDSNPAHMKIAVTYKPLCHSIENLVFQVFDTMLSKHTSRWVDLLNRSVIHKKIIWQVHKI
jgi:hypothetical protein